MWAQGIQIHKREIMIAVFQHCLDFLRIRCVEAISGCGVCMCVCVCVCVRRNHLLFQHCLDFLRIRCVEAVSGLCVCVCKEELVDDL